MSLKPEGINPVPEETARITHAAYPKGNVFMHMRDVLGTMYEDESFAPLFSYTGQPAEAPWRLALVSIMQFAQGLCDRQAADAVRGRIDWKYALGLELADPGFAASVLSEFRPRLVEGHAEEQLLTGMLTLFKQQGWLKARGKQRTHSTPVLAKIRAINRLVCVGETLGHALNCLAIGLLNGCWLTVSRRGWIAMVCGWRTRGFLLVKKIVRPGFRALAKMERQCSMPSLSQAHPPGSQKCLRWIFCGAYGSRTISGAKATWAGVPQRTSLLLACISVHLMIWMRTPVRSAPQAGWGLRSI